GERIFVPHRPQKSKTAGAGRKDVARAAPYHLARCRGLAVKADYLKAAKHHPRRCASKNGEQREVLHVNNAERCGVDRCTELAEREGAPERPKQSQEGSVGEQQTRTVDQPRDSPLFNGRDRIKAWWRRLADC